MTLSKLQTDIIAAHPLGDTLLDSRAELVACAHAITRPAVMRLLFTLVESEAAHLLPSPGGMLDVWVKLYLLRFQIRDEVTDPDQCRPLVDCVIDRSTDYVLWETAFHLSGTLVPPNPPFVRYTTHFEETPIEYNSSKFDNSRTREIEIADLLKKLRTCTFRNVSGFCQKYLDSKNWNSDQTDLLNSLMKKYREHGWIGFPDEPDHGTMHQWFGSLREEILSRASNKWLIPPVHTHQGDAPVHTHQGDDPGRQNLYVLDPAENTRRTPCYKDVFVVGQLTAEGDFDNNLLELARCVQKVFTDQPLRQFVHAFTLCSSAMELWVFDRSGPFSSGVFDIHREPLKFARALVAYATMSKTQAGLPAFLEQSERLSYVTVNDANNGKEIRIRLDKALVRSQSIVSRATTCYGTDNACVAKFAWLSDQHTREVTFLEDAARSDVKGVAKMVAYRQLATVAALREGLGFPKVHRFQSDEDHDDMVALARILRGERSRSPQSSEPSPKRQRTSSATESSTDTSTNLTTSSLAVHVQPQGWENKDYTCLVVSPAGRVINDFENVSEMLAAMLDAIKAHRSLHDQAGILHRDISPNNIIITEPEVADGCRGMLIDLDVARKLKDSTREVGEAVGTLPFLAINVLWRKEHTYRHDLESFFYVLLWLCAYQSWELGFGHKEERPRESLLASWHVGSLHDIMCQKSSQMRVNGFNDILAEFPPSLDSVKPLCSQLRSVLFGEEDSLRLDTPRKGEDDLYDSFIKAFEDCLKRV